MPENKFYVYVYLDTRKPGKYQYGEYCFDYEPFYVGKGWGRRIYRHIEEAKNYSKGLKRDSYNPYKINKINSILKDDKEPQILILKNNLFENDAFELEKELIKKIGIKENGGVLTNLTDGGLGGGNEYKSNQKCIELCEWIKLNNRLPKIRSKNKEESRIGLFLFKKRKNIIIVYDSDIKIIEKYNYDNLFDKNNIKKRKLCLSFEEAHNFVLKLGLKSISEWKKYCRSGKKPDNILYNPNRRYKSEWVSWGHWLGTNRIADKNKKKLDINIKILYNRNMENAKFIIQRLRENGYDAYIAGGCCRDMVISVEPHDIDIVTSALPDDIERVFNDFKCLDVGKSFGVIVVIINNNQYEIATMRTDSKDSKDSRRPDSVTFVSDLKLDASRRDFTFNSMYCDPLKNNEIIDFFNGKEDLKNGIVKFVGCSSERLEEDILRAMRYVRFSAKFGKEKVDQASFEAVKENAHKIHRISAERIKEELEKGLSLSDTSLYIDLLMKTGLMHEILPEIEVLNSVEQSPIYHPEGNVLNHVKLVLEALKGESLNLKLAGLLHDIGKTFCTEVQEDGKITSRGHAEIGKEMSEVILKRLKASNSDIEYICNLVGDHMKLIDFIKMSKSSKRKLVSKEYFSDLFKLHKADKINRKGMFKDDIEDAVEAFLKEYSEQIKLPKPFISGRDLILLGLKEGKDIGKVKEYLYDMQLEGLLLDREQALWVAKEVIEKKSYPCF